MGSLVEPKSLTKKLFVEDKSGRETKVILRKLPLHFQIWSDASRYSFFYALSPWLLNNGYIISGQRGKGRQTLGSERRLFGELRLSDGEPVEVGAGDGQESGAKVAGDGERAVDPTRESVEERIE